jgi:hypothetical protein
VRPMMHGAVMRARGEDEDGARGSEFRGAHPTFL